MVESSSEDEGDFPEQPARQRRKLSKGGAEEGSKGGKDGFKGGNDGLTGGKGGSKGGKDGGQGGGGSVPSGSACASGLDPGMQLALQGLSMNKKSAKGSQGMAPVLEQWETASAMEDKTSLKDVCAALNKALHIAVKINKVVQDGDVEPKYKKDMGAAVDVISSIKSKKASDMQMPGVIKKAITHCASVIKKIVKAHPELSDKINS